MRHKILDAVRIFMGIGDVDGVVEMDETFVAESFKGNHKKSGCTVSMVFQRNFLLIISIGLNGLSSLKKIKK